MSGKFGGSLHFPKKGTTRPQFSGVNMLGYDDKSWSATVSVWLRLTPDEDLEPCYCDPVQIVGDDTKKGFIFLEWSKDEKPRVFSATRSARCFTSGTRLTRSGLISLWASAPRWTWRTRLSAAMHGRMRS